MDICTHINSFKIRLIPKDNYWHIFLLCFLKPLNSSLCRIFFSCWKCAWFICSSGQQEVKRRPCLRDGAGGGTKQEITPGSWCLWWQTLCDVRWDTSYTPNTPPLLSPSVSEPSSMEITTFCTVICEYWTRSALKLCSWANEGGLFTHNHSSYFWWFLKVCVERIYSFIFTNIGFTYRWLHADVRMWVRSWYRIVWALQENVKK